MMVRRLGVVVASVSVMVAALAGVPAVAADDDPADFKIPASKPNKNDDTGELTGIAKAVAKARSSKEPVELVGARTATETTFAQPDGTIKVERSTSPIRAEKNGKFVALDPSLEAAGGSLRPKVSADDVAFSADGRGSLASLGLGKSDTVGLSVAGTVGEPVVRDGVATYPLDRTSAAGEKAAGESVQVASKAGGFSTRVLLASRPTDAPAYEFAIDAGGLTPSLTDGVLSFTDAAGTQVASSSPLQMWDSKTDETGRPSNTAAVDADLAKKGKGWVLTLRPSPKFLDDPNTQYPVTVDPDLSKSVAEDTYYYSGQPTNQPQAGFYALYVGPAGGFAPVRSLLTFSYNELLGYSIKDADLKLFQYYNNAASPCAPKRTDLFPLTADPTTPVSTMTWATRPTSISSNSEWATSKTFNNGTTCAAATESISVTSMVDGWAKQNLGKGQVKQGIELRANNETDASQTKAFCSADWDATSPYCPNASYTPKLDVTYQPQLGSQSWYSMTNHTINDRSNIAVNNQTGNGLVQTRDLKVKGVGLDLEISRSYNTQSQALTSLGYGWSLSIGPDVWLERTAPNRFEYHAPGGTTFGPFTRETSTGPFTSPKDGVGANLKQDGSTYTLTFRKSQAKFVFTDNATANEHAYLTKIQDRSGNHIDIAYSGATAAGVPKMSSITDTVDRVYTVTYGGDFIVSIQNVAAGAGTRTLSYSYTGSLLTLYTDPSYKSYDYSYTAAAAGPSLLTTIQDPTSSATIRPTTYIDYGTATPLATNQVSRLRYRYAAGANDTYAYTWAYNPTKVAACNPDAANATFSTVVTDPNNHATTYCFQPRRTAIDGDARTWVYDAVGNRRSVAYNADKGPTNVIDPSGAAGAEGSTAVDYTNPNVSDQLSKVTNPKGNAANNATTGFQYSATDAGKPGGDYLPSAVKGGNGKCNRFGYDDMGRTSDSYTGIVATKDDASSCKTTAESPNAKRSHRDYDGAGNVTKSWDANAGSSAPSDADSTMYTYWQTTDAGFVAGTKNLPKTIRKPGGDCSATTAAGRKLCTSYTYDGAGRIATVTNGNAKVTTYAYDAMDRTTGVYFNGATTCNGLTYDNCVQYVYDAEGNLTSRTESAFVTSTFTYDWLNRQISITTPLGLLQPSDVVGSSYDGVGNLTAYSQSIESGAATDYVYYSYDAADRLSGVSDSTAVSGTGINVTADKNGRTQSIVFPKPAGTNGMKVDYDYTGSGKPNKLNVKMHSGADLVRFTYDYKKTLYAAPFVITVETPQMRNRTIDAPSASLNFETNVNYDYNDDNRLTSATDSLSSGTTYTYDFDNAGNVTKEQQGSGSSSSTYYGYNRAGELCWKGANTGNQLSRSCPSTPSGNTTVAQDANGNSTNTSADPIAYNDRDQATTVGGVAMTYRDLGNDIRATTGSSRTIAGPLGITAVKSSAGTTFYTRDPQGTVLNSHGAGGTVNYVTEFNGSVAGLYNPAGAIVGSYKYAPYGSTGVSAEASGTTNAATNPFRYIGGFQDKTSTGADGNYKLGARYYDTHSHFTQADPIIPGGGDYKYTNGDPINSSDPSGYQSISAQVGCEVVTGTIAVTGAVVTTAASGGTAAPFYAAGFGGAAAGIGTLCGGGGPAEAAIKAIGGAVTGGIAEKIPKLFS